jgi:hypothetical protein
MTEPTPMLPCPRCYARLDSPYLHAQPQPGPDGPGESATCGLCGSLWTSHVSFEPPNLDPTPQESVARFEAAQARFEEAQRDLEDARRRWQADPTDSAAGAAYFGAYMRAALVTPDPGAWARQLDPPLDVGDLIRAVALRER